MYAFVYACTSPETPADRAPPRERNGSRDGTLNCRSNGTSRSRRAVEVRRFALSRFPTLAAPRRGGGRVDGHRREQPASAAEARSPASTPPIRNSSKQPWSATHPASPPRSRVAPTLTPETRRWGAHRSSMRSRCRGAIRPSPNCCSPEAPMSTSAIGTARNRCISCRQTSTCTCGNRSDGCSADSSPRTSSRPGPIHSSCGSKASTRSSRKPTGATERGTLTVPCGVFRHAPAVGDLVRCQKGLSPGLDEAWSEFRRKAELGIERER